MTLQEKVNKGYELIKDGLPKVIDIFSITEYDLCPLGLYAAEKNEDYFDVLHKFNISEYDYGFDLTDPKGGWFLLQQIWIEKLTSEGHIISGVNDIEYLRTFGLKEYQEKFYVTPTT